MGLESQLKMDWIRISSEDQLRHIAQDIQIRVPQTPTITYNQVKHHGGNRMHRLIMTTCLAILEYTGVLAVPGNTRNPFQTLG